MNNSPFDKLERVVKMINRHLDDVEYILFELKHHLKGSVEQVEEPKLQGDHNGNCQ